MFDWIKNINKDYPEFYKRYLQKFEQRGKRFVVISLHTSGNNPEKDVIFSFGALAVVNNVVAIGDQFEVIIPQYKYLHDHNLSMEFIMESQMEKRTEAQAVEAFLEYIGNSILVGYRVQLQVDMINQALAHLNCGRLKNEALDLELMHRKFMDISPRPVSLDEMIKAHKLPELETDNVADEAYIRALLFLKLKNKLQIQ